MHTPKKVQPFSSKRLPPGCALPRLKSLFIDQATKGAGRTLYEILGMAELMRVAYEKGELESLQQRLSVLLSDAAGLSTTLSNIIELARLETEAAEPAFKEFDIVALLERVAQATHVLIGEKPVAIMDVASPGPLVVLSDPWKVRQIMTGLTNNAAKFTTRGRIALIVNKDDDFLRLIVTDTGCGMSPEEIAAYFPGDDNEFDGQARPDAGSHLGIRIVRRMVRSLDGRISVSSKIGEGTIVEVALPLIPASRQCRLNTSRHLIQA
jgi:signal transduction histidine kinase